MHQLLLLFDRLSFFLHFLSLSLSLSLSSSFSVSLSLSLSLSVCLSVCLSLFCLNLCFFVVFVTVGIAVAVVEMVLVTLERPCTQQNPHPFTPPVHRRRSTRAGFLLLTMLSKSQVPCCRLPYSTSLIPSLLFLCPSFSSLLCLVQ
jgi:hypothetical protein